jgi:hypothetical protein
MFNITVISCVEYGLLCQFAGYFPCTYLFVHKDFADLLTQLKYINWQCKYLIGSTVGLESNPKPEDECVWVKGVN